MLGAARRGGRSVTPAEIDASIIEKTGFGPDAAKGMSNLVRANLLSDQGRRTAQEGRRAGNRAMVAKRPYCLKGRLEIPNRVAQASPCQR